MFSALNLAALMVHQFVEYGFPGYFPGMMNGGFFKSDKPDRYPLNEGSMGASWQLRVRIAGEWSAKRGLQPRPSIFQDRLA